MGLGVSSNKMLSSSTKIRMFIDISRLRSHYIFSLLCPQRSHTFAISIIELLLIYALNNRLYIT